MVPCPTDEVLGDEEVAGVPGALDDPHLVVEALLDLGRERVAVTLLGPLERQMLQEGALVGVLFRDGKLGEEILLLEDEVHLIRDLQRVLDEVGTVREPRRHLFRALEVEPFVVMHPVRVVAVLTEPDAEQDVVRLMILRLEEVGVVGHHRRQPQLRREVEDLPVQLGLTLRIVRLDLEVVATVEQVRVPLGGLPGRVVVVGHQVARHLARHAGGRDDEPLVVPRQHLAIDARLVVEALGVPDGGELHEVAVADQVSGQEHEVVVGPVPLSRAGAVPPVPGRDVRLHADDGLEPFLRRHLVEVPRAEHAPVVGQREPRHLVLFRLAHEVRQAVGAVEEGELGMGVEVDEAHVTGRSAGPWGGRSK